MCVCVYFIVVVNAVSAAVAADAVLVPTELFKVLSIDLNLLSLV